MALSIWIQDSGYSFGIRQERETVDINLPTNNTPGVTFSVIAGKLPPGLRISGYKIVGTPYEVPRTTEFKFVIRATAASGISDRTFYMTVAGADEPQWISPSGPLPVGANNAYFVLETSYIDFQLGASDTDTAVGQKLNYFIASGEGELPPGLLMTSSGRITGFIQPLLQIPAKSGNGPFDTDLYDSVAYDFGFRPSNGYDSFVYDSTVFDFFVPTTKPRKLNRNYEFIATITDGDTVNKRKYRIFVVGDDFFRADNTITSSGSGTFTADVTYVRTPIFTTPANLGIRRANNYQTFKIDIFEGFTDLGPINFSYCDVNARISGIVRKESASDNRQGLNFIRFERASDVPKIGQFVSFAGDFPGATGKTYDIIGVDTVGGDTYRITVIPNLDMSIPDSTAIYIGDKSKLPPGMSFDGNTGEVFGVVPYQSAVTREFNFTIKATRFGQSSETASSRRLFTVKILGEVESVMTWNSPSSLGSINAGYVSDLFVHATSTFSPQILYRVTSGKLPAGLSLNFDGEIVGKVNEVNDQVIYKSYWKPSKNYAVGDVVKQDNTAEIRSIIRRKNIATVVTTTDHNFKNGALTKVITDTDSFNFYDSVKINLDPVKVLSVIDKEQTGSIWRVKFDIVDQNLMPLAPVFTLAEGNAISTSSFVWPVVSASSTSGTGTGAVFRVEKVSNLINPIYRGVTTIKLIDPGVGYKPGDSITVSGSQLGGVDGLHDLTFVTSSGLEFYYEIRGQSTSTYNGRWLALSSTIDSLTLGYPNDPGFFGSGIIGVSVGIASFEGQTQVLPLNYFSYENKGRTTTMAKAIGSATASPSYYKSNEAHNSGLSFDPIKWDLYEFPVTDLSLTAIDGNTFILDGAKNTTTFDREYTFTVEAADPLRFSAVEKTFTLTVETPNDVNYSNITVKPFLKPNQRELFKSFMNNVNIFDQKYIYRPYDKSYGIQKDLRMLVYAGIETRLAAEYISAMGKNHKAKRFRFGEIKSAVAKTTGTNDIVYEVVYIEMIDTLEKNGKTLPLLLKLQDNNRLVTVDQNNQFYDGPQELDTQFWNRPIPFNSTIDRTDVYVGDPETTFRFPSSISLWRYRIRNMPNTKSERNYLPLWMRSIQPGSATELNYTAAVPLCFCLPGKSAEILLNIKNSNFDPKILDYTVDRYIIDSVDGAYDTDKYLVFRNDRTTLT